MSYLTTPTSPCSETGSSPSSRWVPFRYHVLEPDTHTLPPSRCCWLKMPGRLPDLNQGSWYVGTNINWSENPWHIGRWTLPSVTFCYRAGLTSTPTNLLYIMELWRHPYCNVVLQYSRRAATGATSIPLCPHDPPSSLLEPQLEPTSCTLPQLTSVTSGHTHDQQLPQQQG